jgi:hypothetical protein
MPEKMKQRLNIKRDMRGQHLKRSGQYSIFGNEQELNSSAKYIIDMACVFFFSRGFLGTVLYSNTHFTH